MNKNKITIVLSESDHAKEFSEQNLIYKAEFEKVIKHIEQALETVNKNPNQMHLHNTITISGTRGSGKTSFLLSINKRIKNREQKEDVVPMIVNEDIEVLSIIDPTVIEEKAHVFLNVIASIKKLVEDKLDKDECDSVYKGNDRHSRKEWDSYVLKLAAGLPTIDDSRNKNMDDWQDPEFIMQRGLVSVSSALNLAQNFDRVLEHALGILKKKAFLLSFDDIDVHPDKGWDVLECIRKYFTTPRLITILSGDMKLYTTLVRQKKWESLSKNMMYNEPLKLPILNEMVTELTSQYLLKVLQPKNRIDLNTLLEQKNKNGGLNIWVAYMKNLQAKEDTLEEIYDTFLRQHGIRNRVQQEVYKNFFLAQPLRSQIHLLAEIIKESSDHVNITRVFLSDLLEKNINVNQVHNNPKFLNTNILDLLLKDHLLKDNYQLQPVTTDNSLNASLFSLSILESQFIQHDNLYLIFDYMMRVGYVRNLLSIIQPDLKENRSSKHILSYTPSIEDMYKKTGLLQEGVLRDIMGHVQSYLYGYYELLGNKGSHTTSYIQLLGLQEKAKRSKPGSLDGAFVPKEASNSQKILGHIPGFSASFNHKNESRVAYSIYLLLSAIGELLKVYETSLKYDPESEKDGVKTILKELSQLRSYPVFEFSISSTPESEDGDEEDNDDGDKNGISSESNTDTDEFYETVIKWMKDGKSRIQVSPHVLGKTSTRFFYTMINMMGRKPNNKWKLGDIFHYQIIAFMNSILIEDIRENIKDISFLNINNTNYSNKIFIDNLNNEKTKKIGKDDLIFSRWLLACPLLTAYLNFEPTLKDALTEYSQEFVSKDHAVISVYELLNKVELKDTVKSKAKAVNKTSKES